MTFTLKNNLTGQKFYDWTVICWSSRNEYGKQMWLCECKCGDRHEVESYNLTAGRTKACRHCSATVANGLRKTHGQSCTKVYLTWQGLKTRCYNKKSKSFKYHGALGVGIAAEWRDNYPAFAEYMGEPPTPYHVIDRIEWLDDYAPGNVRWVTMAEQNESRRKWMARLRGDGEDDPADGRGTCGQGAAQARGQDE